MHILFFSHYFSYITELRITCSYVITVHDVFGCALTRIATVQLYYFASVVFGFCYSRNARIYLSVTKQIAVTIWRLATTIGYRTISALFGIGISTVCTIVCNTTRAITQHLLPQYVKMPSQGRLREIVQEFETLWRFPQVVGALDGTHIPILKPTESPSDYYV